MPQSRQTLNATMSIGPTGKEKKCIVAEPQRGALPGRRPGRGLLIPTCQSHPLLCVGLVWFGLDVRPFCLRR